MSIAAVCVSGKPGSGEIAFGADSMVTWGSNVYIESHKIIKLSTDCWGIWAGQVRAGQIISHMLQEHLREHEQPDSLYDVIEVMGLLYQTIIDFGAEDKGIDGDMPLQPSQFFFISKHKVYLILNDYSVTEITHYAAIGSGADLALGVLCDKYRHGHLEPGPSVRSAIEAACVHNPYCGGEVEVNVLRWDEASNTKSELEATAV